MRGRSKHKQQQHEHACRMDAWSRSCRPRGTRGPAHVLRCARIVIFLCSLLLSSSSVSCEDGEGNTPADHFRPPPPPPHPSHSPHPPPHPSHSPHPPPFPFIPLLGTPVYPPPPPAPPPPAPAGDGGDSPPSTRPNLTSPAPAPSSSFDAPPSEPSSSDASPPAPDLFPLSPTSRAGRMTAEAKAGLGLLSVAGLLQVAVFFFLMARRRQLLRDLNDPAEWSPVL